MGLTASLGTSEKRKIFCLFCKSNNWSLECPGYSVVIPLTVLSKLLKAKGEIK
jgi:hypothetical protein